MVGKVAVIVVVILLLGGLRNCAMSNTTTQPGDSNNQETATENAAPAQESPLPQVTVSEYKGQEGLIAYKELEAKGYTVDAEFEDETLTSANGSASDVFDPLDPQSQDDRLSVDSFVVSDIIQNGNTLKLIISSQTPATDDEVVAAFRDYLNERASSGVVIAKAVSDITFSDGVVRVTFDPALVGIDRDTFSSISPFQNLAEFVGTPIAFDDDLGKRIRPLVGSVETVFVDGTSAGTLTAQEIYKMGTGKDL